MLSDSWIFVYLHHSAGVRFEPGQNHSQSLMAGNFAALWPTDPKFSAIKDLNPFQTVSKVQEASSILRVAFALSKWPHFNSIYLVRVPFLTSIDVCSVRTARCLVQIANLDQVQINRWLILTNHCGCRRVKTMLDLYNGFFMASRPIMRSKPDSPSRSTGPTRPPH